MIGLMKIQGEKDADQSPTEFGPSGMEPSIYPRPHLAAPPSATTERTVRLLFAAIGLCAAFFELLFLGMQFVFRDSSALLLRWIVWIAAVATSLVLNMWLIDGRRAAYLPLAALAVLYAVAIRFSTTIRSEGQNVLVVMHGVSFVFLVLLTLRGRSRSR